MLCVIFLEKGVWMGLGGWDFGGGGGKVELKLGMGGLLGITVPNFHF